MDIQTVRETESEYIVNSGRVVVPKSETTGRLYRKIQAWLAIEGNALSLKDVKELKAEKVISIKQEAGSRIVTAYPEWKQRNHIAAVVDIQGKEIIALKAGTAYNLSAEESDTVQAAKAATTEIANIRTKSDQLETALDPMNRTQLTSFDPTDNSNWI